MKCIKCGKENESNVNFCSNCGAKLGDNQIQKGNKQSIPVLSWISLGFLCMQIFCFVCLFNEFLYKNVYLKLLFVFEFPYILVSLALAIISRVKNKDTMSLALIILDAVTILLVIIFWIIFVNTIVGVFTSCTTPGTETNNAINSWLESLQGCS